ncbi:MAG TPA: ABC transporter ATP-binding protein [Bellilinea sp.]|nr:ABC transporter ATP-binding protein [Bellilinea sp.]
MLLKIEGLHSGYGNIPILSDINLQMDEHEVVAVIGPNGAGKSTLLKTIAGLVKPTAGRILFNDEEITRLDPDKMVLKGISVVPEGGRVFPNMSVLDNLRMGAYAKREILKSGIIEEIYALFPILQKRGNQYARTLSGGERQMLSIARALVSRPKMIMMDEPSLGVAPKLVDEIYEKIAKLKDTGLTVLLVEQNTGYALELSNRAYVLENGRFTMQGPSSELAESDHIRKAYLGL